MSQRNRIKEKFEELNEFEQSKMILIHSFEAFSLEEVLEDLLEALSASSLTSIEKEIDEALLQEQTFTQEQIDFIKDGICNPLTMIMLAVMKRTLTDKEHTQFDKSVKQIVKFLESLNKD